MAITCRRPLFVRRYVKRHLGRAINRYLLIASQFDSIFKLLDIDCLRPQNGDDSRGKLTLLKRSQCITRLDQIWHIVGSL